MHLREHEIDRYLARELDERTLTGMDAQASVSLPWNQLLARRAMEQTGWERRGFLGRLVRIEPRHEAIAPPVQEEELKAA